MPSKAGLATTVLRNAVKRGEGIKYEIKEQTLTARLPYGSPPCIILKSTSEPALVTHEVALNISMRGFGAGGGMTWVEGVGFRF